MTPQVRVKKLNDASLLFLEGIFTPWGGGVLRGKKDRDDRRKS